MEKLQPVQHVLDGAHLDVEKVISGPHAGLAQTVTTIYRLLVETLDREPRVLPANLQSLRQHFAPRMLAGLGQWLAGEMAAARIRTLPVPLLMQQMIGPVLLHFMTRPAAGQVPGLDLPDTQEACAFFAEAFLRAVTVP